MRRALLLAALAAILFGGCGLESEGGLDSTDGGGGKKDSGTSVGGGTCFPGAKVCPNSKGDLVCVEANTAETGCKSTTACSPCIVPHATASCTAQGKCSVGDCAIGWADCDANAVDGCETNVQGDPKHCGDCSLDCIATQGPGWICTSGQCEVNECCPTGDPSCLARHDCDGDKSNGCEVDTATDPNNCLFCGNVCALANATSKCDAQACKIDTCNAGFANCDGLDANGCETNIASDAGNCGACATKCDSTNGVPGCSNGVCGILCNGGFGDCDSNAANGCEVNLTSDPGYCGTCPTVCAPQNATAACTAGQCSYVGCAGGFGDCDGNAANGCETNLTTNVSHCSKCNNPCSAPANAVPVCNGACTFTCNAGFANCGTGTCFNTLTDPTHCGGCSGCPTPTGGAAACDNGVCGVTCNPPYGECANQCFDWSSDKAHCGSCNACIDPVGGTSNCVAGACVPGCPTGQTLCGANCYDLQTNNQHCGICTKGCSFGTTGKSCQAGACVCATGKKDCGNGICVQCCGDVDCTAQKCCLGICQTVTSCT